jgi:glycosyltransferase involved in cell wall biosynthesis
MSDVPVLKAQMSSTKLPNQPNAPNQPWLSILVPIYNVAAYLPACLHSIASQITDASQIMDGGIEVILLDDASSDGSAALAQQFCQAHAAYCTLLTLPHNQGLSVGRTHLLNAARGTYIWFLDADDYLLPSALQDVGQVVKTLAPDIILCDFKTLKKQQVGVFNGVHAQLQTNTQALVCGVFTKRKLHLWSKIFRRTLWPATLQFPKARCFEDLATIPWLLLEAKSYYYIAKPLVFYTSRPGSIIWEVARAPGHFDVAKNQALAQALLGYPQALEQAFARVDVETRFAIAHFCAKELRKIGFRLLRARLFREKWADFIAEFMLYYTTLQACAPMPFAQLLALYKRRLQPIRWLILRLMLGLAKL